MKRIVRNPAKRTNEWNARIKEGNIRTWVENGKGKEFNGENNPCSKLANEDVLFIYKEGKKYQEHLKKHGRYAKYNGYRYSHLEQKFCTNSVGYIVNGVLWSSLTGEPRRDHKGNLRV